MRLFATAVVLAALVGSASIASAESPTPTASSTPTASPTATPIRPVLKVDLVQDGRRVSIVTGDGHQQISADGKPCYEEYGVTQVPKMVLSWGDTWPLEFLVGNAPAECTKGPPTVIGVKFTNNFAPEFVWTGGDQSIEFEVPAPRIDVMTVRFAKAGRPVAINNNFVGVTPKFELCLETRAGSSNSRIEEVLVSLGSWTICEPHPGQTIELAFRVHPIGGFVSSLIWPGGDMTTVVEVPDSIPTTDLPAMATPAALPNTGGQPSDPDRPWHIASLGIGLLVAVAGFVARRARRVIP